MAEASHGKTYGAERGAWLSDPLNLGPFALLSTGGALGDATNYVLDVGAMSTLRAGEGRASNAEMRGLERGSLESAVRRFWEHVPRSKAVASGT